MPSDSAAASVVPLPSGSALPGSCTEAAACDDGSFCNGAEQCVDGFCQPGTAVVCDDGVPCTVDRCDELLADCAFMPDHAACTDAENPLCDPVAGCNSSACESDADCDDGVACNGAEQCTDIGSCEAGEPIVCDDDVECTHDACSEVSGECEFDRDNSVCDDGLWCNGLEVCRASGCDAESVPTIDDGIPCTRDVCDEASGEIEHVGQTVTLTIKGTTGFGRVTVDSELVCDSPPCSFSEECGATALLTGWTSQTNSYGFNGWSNGDCPGTSPCLLTLHDDVSIIAKFAPANIAFVTSTTTTGNVGGLAGADAECQDRASAAGWSGTFRAWLFTSYDTPYDRFNGSRGWVLPDGRPFMDELYNASGGALFNTLRLDEYGNVVADVAVRTGWYDESASPFTCQDWTDASSANYSYSGRTSLASHNFQNYDYNSMLCDADAALYCFQVDRAVTVRPVPDSGRVAFTTRGGFLPGGGIYAADSLCQDEASAAGLPGSYLAMLATSTASAESRFDLSGLPWVRPDGIRITSSASELFTADHWDTGANVTADGLEYLPHYGTLAGGTSLTEPGTLDNTCQDWTATTGTGTGGLADVTEVEERLALHFGCEGGYRFVCLQE